MYIFIYTETKKRYINVYKQTCRSIYTAYVHTYIIYIDAHKNLYRGVVRTINKL